MYNDDPWDKLRATVNTAEQALMNSPIYDMEFIKYRGLLDYLIPELRRTATPMANVLLVRCENLRKKADSRAESEGK